MLGKKIVVFLLSFFLLLLMMISLFGDVVWNADGFKIIGGTDDLVWWNTTELSTESYTAPFFEVYKLKDYGQMAFGLDVADFNGDGYDDFVSGGSVGVIRMFKNNGEKI